MGDARELFNEGVDSYMAVVWSIGPDEWDLPGLGEWTIRELVAHAARAMLTVEEYLGGDGEVTLHSPSEYYAAAMSLPGIHAAVAERGREAGRQFDTPAKVAELMDRVVPLVAATPLDALMSVRGGTVTLDTYLHTRVLELVVHTDDICRALGRAPVASAELVQAVAAVLVGMLDAEGIAVIRALLGRGSLDDVNLFDRT